QQSMEHTGSDHVDVLAVAQVSGQVCVNLAMVRGGRHLGDKAFFPDQTHDDAPADVLAAFVAQHYADSALPPVLVASHNLSDDRLLCLLAERSGTRARLIVKPQGVRRIWLEQAMSNAELALARRMNQSGNRTARTRALAAALDMDTDDAALESLHIE